MPKYTDGIEKFKSWQESQHKLGLEIQELGNKIKKLKGI